ncbi:hypothetical protein FRZ06_21065 [Anoxybacterium hadale]|uniref:Uncharacterized protein n=1 Tax=Anoxybacterium hadale TaxID=3408580 RepID=A0ACD1AH61_9FIRM|nr:hypothetical protein FRZ06_21065 [Clostridiales bacterium]
MKSFRNSTTIKYSLEIDGKTKKGKIRAYIPPMNELSNFTRVIFSQTELEELLYLLKMIKFSTMFPIEKNEYVDYQEMMRCGLISNNNHTSPLDNSDVKTLFYNAVKNSFLKVNMSEQGYYSFRDMVLEEFDEFDNELDDMFKREYRKRVRKLSLDKRLRILFTRKKLDKLKEEFRKETWLMLISSANSNSNEIAEKDFPQRAVALLESFDQKKYEELIHEVTNELNLQSPKVYKEVIEFLNDVDIQKNSENILGWIIDNTCSTETAFENMKREADYITKELFYKFSIHFYQTHRKAMSREEKRLFQLCYFRREAFQYRIPALDDFMRSFWSGNMQLIFSGLIMKDTNPDYDKDNKILEEKWKEFLTLYPHALSNQNLFNHLKDAKKIKEMINRNYYGKDLQILHAFVDGHEIDTIIAKFGCSKKYCVELIERYKEDAKVQNEAPAIIE